MAALVGTWMTRGRRLTAPNGPRAVALALVLGTLLVPALVAAEQTFPDPFDGEGTFTDVRTGAKGEDIGDAFFLREGTILRIRVFLDPPATITETHVCLSADPFTERIPPGQCQYQASGAAAATYDLALPPSEFPAGTTPFTDPLAPFCVQLHVAFTAPGLALTSDGGGSAFAGWEPGQPFFGNVCFSEIGPPEPDGPIVEVDKTGTFDEVDGTVVFTVVVRNDGDALAENVVVVDVLDPALSWTVPGSCSVVASLASCAIPDLAPGESSAPLVFVGVPADGYCGTVDNRAGALVGVTPLRSSRSHTAVVEIPCPPEPPDPLLLLEKVPASESVAVPGTVVWIVTLENAGPGDAVDVVFEDELPPGIAWSLGSGENVCSIDGTTLTCAAALVPDGVFERLEIFGAVDGSMCGRLENEGSLSWSGGPVDGSTTAISPPVDVVGCPAPSPTPNPTASASPDESAAAGGETPMPSGEGTGGQLPDTRATRPSSSIGMVIGAIAVLGAALVLRRSRLV